MRHLLAALLLIAPLPSLAAEPQGLPDEKPVEIEGRVVDVACAIKGDCPADCGGGRRLLGILQADGKLRLAAKGPADFAGAVRDLLPYCGRTAQVDGLLIESPLATMLLVQRTRGDSSQEWKPADAFLTEWTARNGASDAWMRADPAVKAIIAADGVLGIKGLEPKK